MTTQTGPRAYAITAGVTSSPLLPQNPSRRGLMIHNPSMVNTISVCPALDNNGNALAAVLNGAGSFTIFTGGLLVLPQPGMDNAGIGAAFNVIASGASTPVTVWEF